MRLNSREQLRRVYDSLIWLRNELFEDGLRKPIKDVDWEDVRSMLYAQIQDCDDVLENCDN